MGGRRFNRAVVIALALAAGWRARSLTAQQAPPPAATAQEASLAQVEALNESGKYAEAEALARRLLADAERDHGPDSLPAAAAIEPLVVALHSEGKASQSETRALAERSLAIREKVLGPDHPDVAAGLDNLAVLLHDAGDLSGARPLYERSLAIHENALGPDHPDVAMSLNNLARLLEDVGDLSAARPLCERSLAIREKALGPDHPDVATGLNNLASLLDTGGDYAAARPLYERSLAIKEKALGPDHPGVALGLNNLASLLHTVGDHAAARPLYERSLAIREKALGPDHPAVADSVNNLASLLHDAGDLSGARTLLERSLAIREKALGPDHPDVAASLNNLAGLLDTVGDYPAAQPLYERCLAILEKSLGPDHPNFAQSLNNLASLLQDAGDYDAARPLLERSIAIKEKALGPDHPDVALGLNNLATLLKAAGDLSAARPLFERALAIDEEALGTDHPDVALGLNNLASLLQDAGDYDAARPLFERSLAIWEKARAPDHPDVALGLNNLASLLQHAGDPRAARPLLERSLAIWEKALGPDHPHVAMSLSNLAALLRTTGDLSGERPLYERALAINEKALGPDHPDVAHSLTHLAHLLRAVGDLSAAQRLHERALAIWEKALGPDHPNVATSLNNLARLLVATGARSDAFTRALQAEVIGREHLRLTAATLSQREALRYAATRDGGLDVALSCATARRDPSRAAQVLDQLVRSRGLTLDVLAERRRVVELSPELGAVAHARTAAATRLARLMARGLGNDTPERYGQLLGASRKEMEEAERELGRRSEVFRERQRGAQVGLAAVKAALAQGDMLVAYTRFTQVPVLHPGQEKPTPGKDELAYAAFVLKAGEAQPILVPLGAAQPLELAASRWRNAATDAAADVEAARSSGTMLRKLAWDPVASLLGDTRRVIVVPDGALLSVPLGALPTDDGRFLVESAFTIACLSAERDIVGDGDAPVAALAGLLALGGADFAGTASAAPAVQLASAAVATPFRGAPSACPTFETMSFQPLPATAAEAQDVARAWRRHAGRAHAATDATTLVGALATEATFKREAGRHRVLHLATHGFFLGSECATSAGSRGLELDGRRSGHALPALALENPLLRSGLALAGFNRRSTAAPGEEDGVLTAEEVASLDLSGVEWAVLSACETGLGDVQAGEGVLGLQRAFKIAGADSVIMSLWKVPDADTRQFMRELYEAHLTRGLDAAESVRAASLAVLRERRARGESDAPYWWGAFVASGR